MSFRAVRSLAAAVMLLVAGCAAFAPGSGVPPAEPFDILGRVLASNDGRAFSAGFRWQHETAENEIWLMSPVGQTLAHIASNAGGATLTTADQQEYQALSVESLTRRALGWPLPLEQLQHWIRGRLVPGGVVGAVTPDSRGRPALIEQDGWRIRYGYPEEGAVAQPRQLDLTRDGQRIRMVIDQWRERQP